MANWNLYEARKAAEQVTNALNAIGMRAAHDQDVVVCAEEANYFWEARIADNRTVFAYLWVNDGEAGFGVDVRQDGEPLARFGEASTRTLTAPAITGLIAQSVALAAHGHPLTALNGR